MVEILLRIVALYSLRMFVDLREYRATMGRALIGCCHWATANQSSPHRGPSSFVGDLNFPNTLHELHELHFLFVFRD